MMQPDRFGTMARMLIGYARVSTDGQDESPRSPSSNATWPVSALLLDWQQHERAAEFPAGQQAQ